MTEDQNFWMLCYFLENKILLIAYFVHVSVLSCSARHLLEENNQAFCQISANLSTLKVMLECSGHVYNDWI